VQPQAHLFHPRGQHVTRLPQGAAVHDRVIGLCRLPDYAARTVDMLVRALVPAADAA
jgi:hypothetical protein